jgi:Ca2+-binding RTX toxin-like protein
LGNDELLGSSGNDVLNGNDGNDYLTGSGNANGLAEVDILLGGGGTDTFVLSNYADAGDNDYAIIKDYAAEDTIKDLNLFCIGTSSLAGVNEIALFADNGNDLVAIVAGDTTYLSLIATSC